MALPSLLSFVESRSHGKACQVGFGHSPSDQLDRLKSFIPGNLRECAARSASQGAVGTRAVTIGTSADVDDDFAARSQPLPVLYFSARKVANCSNFPNFTHSLPLSPGELLWVASSTKPHNDQSLAPAPLRRKALNFFGVALQSATLEILELPTPPG